MELISTRTYQSVHRFYTMKDHESRWNDVVIRVTLNKDTNEIIEEIDVRDKDALFLRRPLPKGIRNIVVRYYGYPRHLSDDDKAYPTDEKEREKAKLKDMKEKGIH